MQNAIKTAFSDLEIVLQQITNEQYCTQCSNLFKATIGQHVRHILELFESLLNGYSSGIVNYDNRKRDVLIETEIVKATALMNNIRSRISKPDKILLLETDFGAHGEIFKIESNFTRELAYNLEHAIHHMAMIKVGIIELGGSIVLPENFGVASATIKHRKVCAQ